MSDEPLRGRELEAWRTAYRDVVARDAPDTPDVCPTDQALAELVVGEAGAAAREQIAAHVFRCPRCAERYRVAKELHRESAGGAAGIGRRTLVAAAAILLVVLAGVLWTGIRQIAGLNGGEPVRDVLRDVDEMVSPADQATLDGPPTELVWPSSAPAGTFRVRLFDAAGEIVWEANGEGGRVRLPDDVRSRLRPGESYFWLVDVPAAPSRPQRGPFWFRIER